MSNDIKKLLRIIEPNLITSDISYEMVKGQQTCVVNATFSPPLTPCHHCGSTVYNESGKQVVVRNGKKKAVVRFDQFNHLPLIMNVAKQRYTCKNCAHHWTATPYFVEKGHSISRHVILKIIDLLKEKISFTLIAKLCHVSITTVIRVLRSIKSYLPNPYQTHLPEVLMVDEFRSHCSSEDTMSFICADGITGKLINILPSRKLTQLTAHFKKYPNPNDVKFLVTDMNAAYFQLTKNVFPTAKLIIDRFHIVKHLNTAFNDFRVREMKRLITNKKKSKANKLKSNWKLLLKNQTNISISEFKTWRSFPSPKYHLLTESMVIDRLLSFSSELKEAYDIFHLLMYHFRNKDDRSFFELLKNLPDSLDTQFRDKIENLISYEEGIRNALKYNFSNGKIEAKNTHIKTLKRVSYGFNSFTNMRIRIFLINGLIKIK
ncbi:ISL3 family transposase [Enterococcus faecalis]|nr:ISL3 family transposase [Enterococcus faecalis]